MFHHLGLTSTANQNRAMNKVFINFGQECFGFRKLISPRLTSRISACLLSTSNSTGGLQSLPRLPVPALAQTLEKYLKTVKPHLNNEQLNKTKQLIQEFGGDGSIGQKLQQLLQKKAQETENWLADWWLHSAYLDFRWPVVVYSNPGLVFPFQDFKSKDDQLQYAAKMVLAAMDYKSLIDGDKIPQEKMGKELLDMGQYKKVFGTCRIPGIKRDKLSFNQSDFIVVFHNGHIFKLPLKGDDNVLLSEPQIVEQLKNVIAKSSKKSANPLGIMTSEHRDTWGKVYSDLIKDDVNKASVGEIEKSLFVLCLDIGAGGLDKQHWERQTIAGGQTIHGGGSDHNSGNRWFDKTIQFVVGEDGINGLTYEHSPAEGQPIAVLTDHIIDFIDNNKSSGKEPSKSVKQVEKLEFKITPDTEQAIDNAKKNIDKLVADLKLNCFTFGNYGKDFIKSQKLSPDSFIQMAMQFAFYRLHKVPAAHYESAATRKYIGGRTETIRSCSEESVNFAKTMLDSNSSVNDKVTALKNAINSHKDYSIQAVNGLGVDRHLLGLKLIAIENNIELPKIYSDDAFVKSSHMRISSSQVAARCDGFMCYGPLVADGYATCYNPRPKSINFATSAFANPETDVNKYRKALEDSLVDMHNILLQGIKSKL